MTVHTDSSGGTSALLWAEDDETGGCRVERRSLETGAPAGDPLPDTLRSVYHDGGQTMMVLSEPDGTITIQPLPQPQPPPASAPMLPFG